MKATKAQRWLAQDVKHKTWGWRKKMASELHLFFSILFSFV
jgi:hypothetical protein